MSRHKNKSTEWLEKDDSVQSEFNNYPEPTSASSLEGTFESQNSTTWQPSERDNLYAPIILPSQKDLAVKLAPIYQKERLDEYEEDQNIFSILIGLFAGAFLGILCDWATNGFKIINGISVVFISFFFLLSVGSIFWYVKIQNRKRKIVKKY
jgi:hypothetical protein